MKSLMTILMIAALLIPLAHAQTAELDADEIVRRANAAMYYAGEDRRTETRMLIKDGQGRTQRRQFTALRQDVEDGGEQNMLVVFSQPSDVRGTVYLVKKHPGDDDDRWLYLPGLDLVKRISAGDKRTSFVGAHSFYEDVSGRWLGDDEHSLVDTTEEHYVLQHKPRDEGSVEFSDYTTWIDRQTFLPMKTEYRNENGDVYRRVEVLAVETIQDNPTISRCLVSDLETGGSTEIRMRWAEYDQSLPQSLFTERSLRQPPRDWLKPSTDN